MKSTEGGPTRLRLLILADQLMSPVGGGRFIRGFLKALYADSAISPYRFEKVYVLATQAEDVKSLGQLPPGFSVVKRRFPTRLRYTLLARLFGLTLPAVDISFGPFYYVFPGQGRARRRVITLHDLSIFNQQYHPPIDALKKVAWVTRMVHECDGVVCDSDATFCEFQSRWPYLSHKAVRIYLGVSDMGMRFSNAQELPGHSILAVGTIEPRKNYSTLIDAFEQLVHEQGDAAPMLTVVGNLGWMSESVEYRLLALQAAGRCRWLQNASDEQLAGVYRKAGVFTYLSLSEGFGYPPFEAAFARCPMVLSNASSVGEIWSGHATCVDPHDVEGIVAAWKWALALTPSQREEVAATQERRAREFTWSRAIHEYVAFWNRVMSKEATAADQFIAPAGMEFLPRRAANVLDVSVIVVSYNTCALLRTCLASVREKTLGLSYEIIVVDNASSDTSCTMVETEFPEVHLIRNSENFGFARANNQAIKEARGDYIFLLNSDAFLENNAAGIMHDFMHTHTQVGVCGPLLLNADASIQRSIEAYPTVLSMILRLTLGLPLNRAPGPLRDKYHTDYFAYSERCSLTDGWLTGAALMIRREVFFRTGLFDEHYHVYNEDTDWGLAVSRSGWQTWFVPEATVTHLLGASSRTGLTHKELALKVQCLRQNRYYVFKNLGSGPYYAFRCAVFCCASANLLRRLFWAAVSSPGNYENAIFKRRLAWRLFLATIESEGEKVI